VWIGTRGGGLDRVSIRLMLLTGCDSPTSEAQALPTTGHGLRADGTGNIWISTNFGLGRLDPRTGGIQRSPAAWPAGREFNFGAHYRDRGGKLFFGGAAGFQLVLPGNARIQRAPPRVVLTQFLKLNTRESSAFQKSASSG
jgi:hypothetical protein